MLCVLGAVVVKKRVANQSLALVSDISQSSRAIMFVGVAEEERALMTLMMI